MNFPHSVARCVFFPLLVQMFLWEAEEWWFWRKILARPGVPLVPNAARDEPRRRRSTQGRVAEWIRSIKKKKKISFCGGLKILFLGFLLSVRPAGEIFCIYPLVSDGSAHRFLWEPICRLEGECVNACCL